MKYDKYIVRASGSFLKYEFHSDGPKGRIAKQVLYKEFDEYPGVFNLGLGDLEASGEINDVVVTDNSDSEKVLATVALTVHKFFDIYPHKSVFITGSTETRTRLYRMGIAKNLEELQNEFHLFGLIGNDWQPFRRGPDYRAFMVQKKK